LFEVKTLQKRQQNNKGTEISVLNLYMGVVKNC